MNIESKIEAGSWRDIVGGYGGLLRSLFTKRDDVAVARCLSWIKNEQIDEEIRLQEAEARGEKRSETRSRALYLYEQAVALGMKGVLACGPISDEVYQAFLDLKVEWQNYESRFQNGVQQTAKDLGLPLEAVMAASLEGEQNDRHEKRYGAPPTSQADKGVRVLTNPEQRTNAEFVAMLGWTEEEYRKHRQKEIELARCARK